MRLLRSLLLLLCAALLASCTALPTRTPAWATITAALDLGTGGSDWVATIYAQEVHTGKTFHTVMSAGGHGLVVLPTSPPVTFNVTADAYDRFMGPFSEPLAAQFVELARPLRPASTWASMRHAWARTLQPTSPPPSRRRGRSAAGTLAARPPAL